jgi:hypothetical protein
MEFGFWTQILARGGDDLRACLLGVVKCFITYKTFAKYYSDTSQFPGGMSIHEWANSGAKL